jgi:hypothetical protein
MERRIIMIGGREAVGVVEERKRSEGWGDDDVVNLDA